MKVLIVSQHFFPENFRFNDLAFSLKDHGVEVEVLTAVPNYPQGDFYQKYSAFSPLTETINGIKVFRAPIIPRKQNKIFLALNYFSFAFSGSLFALFLQRRKYDAFFVCQSSPIFMAFPAIVLRWLTKKKVYLWITDLWPESLEATGAVRNPIILKLVGKVVKFIYHFSDEILVSSEGFKASILQKIPSRKIDYLPYWAEEFYRPIERDRAREILEHPLCFSEKKFCFLFAGNIGEAQDFNNLLSSCFHLKGQASFSLIVLGAGRALKEAIRTTEKLNLKEQVIFLGKKPVSEMPAYFALADALVISLRKEPIFALTIPSKLQSYMACGKPILACIDGETAEIVEKSGAGFATPAGDPIQLSKAMLRFTQIPPSQREEMGRKALKYQRQYFEKNSILECLVAKLQDR